jgi:hypothetical protein
MSPGAFKNFINDILDKLQELRLGCLIPVGDGTYVRAHEDDEKILLHLVGLLFADDKVLVLGSRKAMDAAAKAIISWKKAWGMECGVVKCATMCVPALEDDIYNKKIVRSRKQVKGKWKIRCEKLENGKTATGPWTAETQDLLDNPVRFEGGKVPAPGECTCLGILFHFTTALCLAHVAKAKALTKRRNEMAQLISNKSHPFFTRQIGVKTILMPVGLHGAEMLGCPITKDTPSLTTCCTRMGTASINKQRVSRRSRPSWTSRCECYMSVPEESPKASKRPKAAQWPSTPSGRNSRSRRQQS